MARCITDTYLTQPYMDLRISTVTLGVGPTPIIGADSSRVGITIQCNGVGVDCYILPSPNVSVSRGIYLASQRDPLWFYYSRDGILVCRDWWGLSPFGGADLTIIELTYRPQRTLAKKKQEVTSE